MASKPILLLCFVFVLLQAEAAGLTRRRRHKNHANNAKELVDLEQAAKSHRVAQFDGLPAHDPESVTYPKFHKKHGKHGKHGKKGQVKVEDAQEAPFDFEPSEPVSLMEVSQEQEDFSQEETLSQENENYSDTYIPESFSPEEYMTRHRDLDVVSDADSSFLSYFSTVQGGAAAECTGLGGRDFCLCATGRSENWVCSFDCMCEDGVCEASSCRVGARMVSTIVTVGIFMSIAAVFYLAYVNQNRSLEQAQMQAMLENQRLITGGLPPSSSKPELDDLITRVLDEPKTEDKSIDNMKKAIHIEVVTSPVEPKEPAAAELRGSVTIIGGGMSCMATASEFNRRNYDITMIEAGNEISGSWKRAFHNRIALPMKYFVDWSLPKDFPKQPKEVDVKEFLDRYIDTRGLRSFVRFGTTVTKVIQKHKGGFLVCTETSGGVKGNVTCDVLVLSTGMFTNPLILVAPKSAATGVPAKVAPDAVQEKVLPPAPTIVLPGQFNKVRTRMEHRRDQVAC